jgi:hypothetical protein
VGRYHASRTILCAVEPGRDALDAVATISYDDAPDGQLHPIHEYVEIDLGVEQLSTIETIVDPVLVGELPTVLWSPHGHHEAVEALLSRVDVILVDSDDGAGGGAPADWARGAPDDDDGGGPGKDDTRAALDRAARLLEYAYVVDLAWLRTTPWRERLAASFDPPHRREALPTLEYMCVRHHPASIASPSLLVGWLASRLGWKHANEGPGVELLSVDQDVLGLAGVTVSWGEACSLSLDRSPGGLVAHQRGPSEDDRVWKVLGASRGEGGILGEGVRQALLRDPTYGPALAAARGVCDGGRR